MKRYNNLAFTGIVFLPISCIGYLVAMILGCVFYNGDLIGTIVMCITLSCVIIMTLSLLVFLNDEFAVTYYDNEKIIQKSFFKKKQIKYEDIKEIYVSGSYIYFTSKEYNLELEEKGFKLQRKINKTLKNEVIIMITSNALFLKYINLENTQVYVLKNNIKITVDKYFK